jgi:hypothetical protein
MARIFSNVFEKIFFIIWACPRSRKSLLQNSSRLSLRGRALGYIFFAAGQDIYPDQRSKKGCRLGPSRRADDSLEFTETSYLLTPSVSVLGRGFREFVTQIFLGKNRAELNCLLALLTIFFLWESLATGPLRYQNRKPLPWQGEAVN